MKNLRIASVALAAFLSCASVLTAGIIEDFRFNDANGTALNAAANSATPAHQWIHDTDHVASIQVQNGSLNIVKNDTNFVTEGMAFDDVSSGTLWMVAKFKDWAVLGTAPDGSNVEEIRFGFMGTEDTTPPPSSTVLAEMMLARHVPSGQFQITGTALGTAGTNVGPASINFVQNQPFIMAMEVNQTTNQYSVYYRDGNNPLQLVGTGNLEPTRDAIVVRMSINNFIGDTAGEFFNLDRFYISDVPPGEIPEPAAFALATLAGLAVIGRRRAG
jgi:hypothetical protein